MALLEVKDLRTSFFTDAGEVKAVNGVSFELERGKVLGIVGESGSGKSVTAYSIMQILAGAGKIVGGYSQGTKVTILEKTVVNGTVWGRTDKGWISLAYVELNASGTDATSKEGLITATVLCIRKGPGTGNAIVGTYTQGQKVTILETTKVGATNWGRTDKGWICMDYVK